MIATLLSTSEPVTVGAVIGLLSGALTLLTAILRYIRKAWNAVDTVLQKINDNERRLLALEQVVAEIRVGGSDSTVDIKDKLESGQVVTKQVPPPAPQPRAAGA